MRSGLKIGKKLSTQPKQKVINVICNYPFFSSFPFTVGSFLFTSTNVLA